MAEKTIARVCLVIFLMVWVSCDYIHISVGKKKENLSVTESPGQSQQEVPVSGVALKESTPATTTPVASQTQPSVPTTLTPEQIFSSYRDSIVEITMMDYLGRPTGTGSGVIISDKGLAVTNHHVLDVAVTAQVRLSNGGMYPVKEVKRVDEANDLVTFVIDASTTPMKPVPLGNSKTLKVGEPVVAIGNPAGLERTLSTGNVSGFRKVSGVDDWVQFTAPISHGSSGGAIFDMKGQLVGVVFSSGVDAERTNQNLNFAVPINVLKHMVAGEIVFSNEETLAFLKDERDYLSVNFSLFANLQGYQSIEPVLAYNRVQNYDGYMRELSRFRSQEMVRLGFLNRLQTFLKTMERLQSSRPTIKEDLGLLNTPLTDVSLAEVNTQLGEVKVFLNKTYVFAVYACDYSEGSEEGPLLLHLVDFANDKTGCVEMITRTMNSNAANCALIDVNNVGSACLEYSRPGDFEFISYLQNKKAEKPYLSANLLTEQINKTYPSRIMFLGEEGSDPQLCEAVRRSLAKGSVFGSVSCVY